MKFEFSRLQPPEGVAESDWRNWSWQLRHSLKTQADFERHFLLSEEEAAGFTGSAGLFSVRSTPYYARLAACENPHDPIRRILMPTGPELNPGRQQMLDPLGEKRHQPVPRIIHRYPDRVLFLVTDVCSVYCRYCTRKHFTGSDSAFVRAKEYDEALSYIKSRTGIREVILSGGDPLTLSDALLEKVLSDLRAIDHIEIVRIGSRMPVVCPMRMTEDLARVIKRFHPVFLMTHFNHPRELTQDSAEALLRLVDNGIPVFNQLVLLNGINNHPAIIQALSRRLLYLRVKPYYMFQCDPSEGTDHLRTSIEESLAIQRELWGRLSGLAMPNLSLDIPDGGGKVGLVPDFSLGEPSSELRSYIGWDGKSGQYINPDPGARKVPIDAERYFHEWESIKKNQPLP